MAATGPDTSEDDKLLEKLQADLAKAQAQQKIEATNHDKEIALQRQAKAASDERIEQLAEIKGQLEEKQKEIDDKNKKLDDLAKGPQSDESKAKIRKLEKKIQDLNQDMNQLKNNQKNLSAQRDIAEKEFKASEKRADAHANKDDKLQDRIASKQEMIQLVAARREMKIELGGLDPKKTADVGRKKELELAIKDKDKEISDKNSFQPKTNIGKALQSLRKDQIAAAKEKHKDGILQRGGKLKKNEKPNFEAETDLAKLIAQFLENLFKAPNVLLRTQAWRTAKKKNQVDIKMEQASKVTGTDPEVKGESKPKSDEPSIVANNTTRPRSQSEPPKPLTNDNVMVNLQTTMANVNSEAAKNQKAAFNDGNIPAQQEAVRLRSSTEPMKPVAKPASHTDTGITLSFNAKKEDDKQFKSKTKKPDIPDIPAPRGKSKPR